MKHRTTDPACVYHRPPKGWLSRWRFDRARGRSCEYCAIVRERDRFWDTLTWTGEAV